MFDAAKSNAPSVLFFDGRLRTVLFKTILRYLLEIDCMAPTRSASTDMGARRGIIIKTTSLPTLRLNVSFG